MEIKIIQEKKEWDEFIIKQPFYTFINSWSWGEFNKLMGNKIFRLGFFENGKLIGLIFLVKIEAKRGTHLFAPYGPVIAEDSYEADLRQINNNYSQDYLRKVYEILPEIKNLARKENACFIRIQPLLKNTKGNSIEFKRNKFKFAPIHIHAEDTWLLDLNRSEDELLCNMRKTTRYLIKRAIKEGVKVEKNNTLECITSFIRMHQEHSNREKGLKYTPFSEKYILNLFNVFPEEDVNLLSAKYDGKVEAMLVSIKYGKTAAYYLGASAIKHPQFSPAYLLQWEAIKKACSESCSFYNFWGIAPDDNPKHPLAGVSLFKKGFGGYEYSLLHSQDIVISPRYWVDYAVESLRRIKRGYYYKK